MLFPNTLVIHGYGIGYGLAVELMVVSAILTLIQVLTSNECHIKYTVR